MTAAAAPCSSGAGKAASGAESVWTAGPGTSSTMARDPPRAPYRSAAVRDPRSDRRPTLGSIGRSQATASRGRRGGRPAPVRPAPAAACPRSRNGTRGRPARGNSTPGRARQPRRYQRLSTRHRQQRDHQHRPRTAITDNLRHRRPSAEAIEGATGSTGLRRPTRHLTPGWRIGGARRRAGRDSLHFATDFLMGITSVVPCWLCVRNQQRASRCLPSH